MLTVFLKEFGSSILLGGDLHQHTISPKRNRCETSMLRNLESRCGIECRVCHGFGGADLVGTVREICHHFSPFIDVCAFLRQRKVRQAG